jgi:Transglycosylase SLT domain
MSLADTKQLAEQAIRETVANWGAGDPAALVRIAQRESGLNPYAVGDKGIGGKAFAKRQDFFRREGNPFADDAPRWDGSFGLYQMMPAYFLPLWDAKADPYSLFDPFVATVVAGRLWNKATRAGADSFVRVRLFWANPSLVDSPADSEAYQKRLDKWSTVAGRLNPPASAFDYSAFGIGPQAGQDELIEQARAAVGGRSSIPTLPTVPPVLSWMVLGLSLVRNLKGLSSGKKA